MERQQVIVADKKMAELVRLVIRVKNGEEVRQVEGLLEGNGEATNDCSRQEDGGVGKVGGLSEEWGGSEAGGGTGAGGTERSNGRTIEGDESGRLSKA
ncbi:hypothetical protein GH714_013964 [Hevea brasiliensis]|uniref:Uncharacterized protein n=1 Tax=Hevea brasiliensis TaxID=3981 RepID=A0A6A6LSM2_HEVBR|nr:hypothetical protein GH714_013964 [Hevea brasiliensis]